MRATDKEYNVFLPVFLDPVTFSHLNWKDHAFASNPYGLCVRQYFFVSRLWIESSCLVQKRLMRDNIPTFTNHLSSKLAHGLLATCDLVDVGGNPVVTQKCDCRACVAHTHYNNNNNNNNNNNKLYLHDCNKLLQYKSTVQKPLKFNY